MKMLLETKNYTIPEILQWFGISRNTWYKRKDYYLDELSTYCMYRYLGKGKSQKIIIEVIYEQEAREYVKRNKKKDEVITIVRSKFIEVWKRTGAAAEGIFFENDNNQYLNTVSIVIDEIIAENPKLLKIYAKSTLYSIALDIKKELFGTPIREYYNEEGTLVREGVPGSAGKCKRMIAVKKENGRLRYLNKEEEELKRETVKRIFGGDKIADCTCTVAYIKKLQEEGKISKSEGFDMITSTVENTENFYKEMKKLGIYIIIATEATIWYEQEQQWITLIDAEIDFLD